VECKLGYYSPKKGGGREELFEIDATKASNEFQKFPSLGPFQ
jgi:hypothetical protein